MEERTKVQRSEEGCLRLHCKNQRNVQTNNNNNKKKQKKAMDTLFHTIILKMWNKIKIN